MAYDIRLQNVRDYLAQVETLDARINAKITEAATLQRTAQTLQSMRYDSERVQVSHTAASPQQEIADKYIDLQQEIEAEIDKFINLKHKIINQINKVNNAKQTEILMRRFIPDESGKTYSITQIADLMHKRSGDNYSYKHIQRMYADALRSFESANHYAVKRFCKRISN